MCVYAYGLYHILFHYNLLQDTEYSSLCYVVGPCCLSVLYTVVGISLHPAFPFYNCKFSLSACESVSVL